MQAQQLSRHIIVPALRRLDCDQPGWQALVLGTALAETGLRSIVDHNRYSYWAIKPEVGLQHLEQVVRSRALQRRQRWGLASGISLTWYADRLDCEDIADQLVRNLAFAPCLCLSIYQRESWFAPTGGDAPKSIEAAAMLYSRAWRAEGGAAERFVSAWAAAGLDFQ